MKLQPQLSDLNQTKSQFLLVALVFAPVAVVIIGSRWLSQIPVGPVFIYDVLMAVTCATAVAVLVSRRAEIGRKSLVASFLIAVFPLVAAVQLARSGFSFEALREFAPFLYLVFGWLVFLLVPFLSPTSLRQGLHLLGGALGVHFLWTVAVRRLPGVEPFEVGEFVVFALRPDIDSALTGVFAAYLLIVTVSVKIHPVVRIVLLGSSVLVGLDAATFGTRAGHLAAVAALGGVVVYAAVTHWGNRFRVILATSAATAVTVTTAVLPLAIYGLAERYIGAINVIAPPKRPSPLSSPGQEEPAGVQQILEPAVISGTARARLNSWQELSSWVFAEPSRWADGVGFGSGYMEESGALRKLLGPLEGLDTAGVGPHNFLLFVLATMGVFFLLAFVAVIIFSLATGMRGFRGGTPQVYGLAFSLALGLLVSSIFGVVFEAPHGAIPFAWALGFLLSAGWVRADQRLTRTKRKIPALEATGA